MRETLQRFHKNKLVPFNEKLSSQHYSFSVCGSSAFNFLPVVKFAVLIYATV